jgi:hypothetical protein
MREQGNIEKPSEISEGRKLIYYIGLILTIVGMLMFLSCFVSVFSMFGSVFGFTSGHNAPFSVSSMGMDVFSGFKRAFIGMLLMIPGGLMMKIGRLGAAGSGLVLDTQQTRDDLKPWAQAGGQLLNDALKQVETMRSAAVSATTKDVVKVRCPQCRTLNDEDARFCDQCGKPM